MALAAGGRRSPLLHQEAACFLFLPVVERTIEQAHANINVKVGKRKVSPPFVSLALRFPELQREQHTGSISMKELESHYEAMCDPHAIAKCFWLQHHPDWQAVLSSCKTANPTTLLKILGHLLYRCDLPSRFLSRKRARHEHDLAVQQETRGTARVLRLGDRRRRHHETLEEMLSQLALEHVRAVASTGACLSGHAAKQHVTCMSHALFLMHCAEDLHKVAQRLLVLDGDECGASSSPSSQSYVLRRAWSAKYGGGRS